MQNPSQGVAQALQSHVHLISSHRFPISQTLNLEQAFRYLIDAPPIVKQIAPMAWHYITPPQDGTMWLEWLHHDPNGIEKPYPSDGYVWGDPEQTYRQEYNGYTIELKVHRIGYRPGYDQVASHARTRYHFYSKNPSVAAAPPDPSLWIVHYHSSDPNQIMAAAQIPVSPQSQQAIAQRRWLEAQGRLDRREFMLHDREHWPTLHVPGQMQQAQYGAMAAMQNRYPQQGGGPPPAKKPRPSGPSISLPGGGDSALDTSIEIEEDTALGDFFDHLTQRDISVARYTQHHRWMEEVFSSPYASNQIVPTDLGLGLMGELKGLTEGILEAPNQDLTDRAEKPPKPKEADPFTNLTKEQVDKFNSRVEKHLEEGRAEIERMKAEHAAKMQDLKKAKTLTHAEKRLRYATWEGHEDAVPTYRLEVPPTGAQVDDLGKETLENVVKDVENLLKVNVTSHEDFHQVARGGLKERKQPSLTFDDHLHQQDILNGMNEQQQPASGSTSTPGVNGAIAGTSNFHEDPTSAIQTAGDSSSKQLGQTFSLGPAQSAANQPVVGQPDDINLAGDSLDLPGMDMNDTLMDGMDIDIDENTLNFDDATHGLVNDTPNDTPSADAPAQATSETPVIDPAAAPAPLASTASVDMPRNPSQGGAQPEAQHGQTKETVLSGGADLGGDSLVGEATDLFDNDDKDMFDDLGNIEGGGDDALIDFDGGDMTLDDSAFGDALHGMDEPDGPGGS